MSRILFLHNSVEFKSLSLFLWVLASIASTFGICGQCSASNYCANCAAVSESVFSLWCMVYLGNFSQIWTI